MEPNPILIIMLYVNYNVIDNNIHIIFSSERYEKDRSRQIQEILEKISKSNNIYYINKLSCHLEDYEKDNYAIARGICATS